MSVIEESWRPVAQTLGFQSEEEMLKDLYVVQLFSLKELAHIVGYSPWSVRRRLIQHHIPLRGRGGDNRQSGKRKLSHIQLTKLMSVSPAALAVEYGVHISTVFAEKRLRREEWNSPQSVQPVG